MACRSANDCDRDVHATDDFLARRRPYDSGGQLHAAYIHGKRARWPYSHSNADRHDFNADIFRHASNDSSSLHQSDFLLKELKWLDLRETIVVDYSVLETRRSA